MKSFNFAFYISLYAAANGWTYLKAPKFLLISIVLTLPLLFLAISALGAGAAVESAGGNTPAKIDGLALLRESLAAVISAMAVTVVFAIYLFQVKDAGLFFFMPRLQGWNYLDGIQLMVFGAGMGACGVGVWSAQPALAAKASLDRAATAMESVFLLRKSPGFRLVVYYLVLTLAWCAGLGAAICVDRSGLPWYAAVIVGGRCAVPLSLLLVSAFIKAPLPAGGILSAAAAWGLFYFNSGKILDSAAFIAGQVLVFVVYAIAAKKFSGGGAPVVRENSSAAAASADSNAPGEDT